MPETLGLLGRRQPATLVILMILLALLHLFLDLALWLPRHMAPAR